MRSSRPLRLALRLALFALLALSGCGRRPSAPPLPRPAVRPAPPTPAPAPAPPTPAWTEAFRLRNAPFPRAGFPDVVVHAPEGFDPTRPMHVVFFAHSWGTYALEWVASGDAQVLPSGPPWVCWGLGARADVARTNTLLVAPQFAPHRPTNWSGRFAQPGFLRAFLNEILGETLAPRLGGPRSVDDVAGITVVGSSAGGLVAHTLVADSDLADKIRNVVLFDAFYSGADAFAEWLARGTDAAPRRFVSVHGGGGATSGSGVALRARLRGALARDVAVDPSGPLTEAVRAHRVVLAQTGCEHVGMALLYVAKVLAGLDLPALPWREGMFEPKAPRADAPEPAQAIAVGARIQGALTRDDLVLRDDSRADDYALDLPAGGAVTLVVRGGRSLTEWHAALDVLVQVLEGGRVLAEDDDGDGGFRARLRFVAPRAGRYTVRVTTHGPWARLGPYTLEAQ